MSLKSVIRYILVLLLLVVLAVAMFVGMDFGKEHHRRKVSDYYIARGVKDTGAINLVTAIYLNYRAYDTLGEATVLFVAVLGVMYLLSYEKTRDENS